jgi:hypothetical protein
MSVLLALISVLLNVMGNVREEIKAMHGKIDWLQTRLIESVTDLE